MRADSIRRHFFSAVFLSVTLLVMFWNLFTLDQSFLSGDHREQQYPWAKFYQSEIRQGSLPWWTTQIQSGFPVLAEGQISAFYPISFLSFYFLPTKVAYNYGILFHYCLAAIFLYAYLQRLRLSRLASVVSCLLFLYGSCQGGYFYYNYISQKSVIWLPLTLIFADRLIEKQLVRDAFFLGVVFAVQIFGGYLQVAVYSILFTILYFSLHWFSRRSAKALFLFVFSGFLGIFFALPQLLPTFELAQFSARANAAKEIAYIGSMSPLGALTAFYPSWDGLLGSELYISVLGLLFFLCSFRVKFNIHRKVFFILSVVFLLLALGEWSPLYRAIIEMTGFHSFRTPIKFLFFVSFSLLVLAGFGFDYFRERMLQCKPFKTVRFYFVLLLCMLALPIAARFLLVTIKPQALPALKQYVSQKFHGSPGHPHSAEVYSQKAESFYESLIEMFTLKGNRNTTVEWVFLLAAALFALYLLRRKTLFRGWKFAVLGFILLDLYFYGGTSIRPNFESFGSIESSEADSPVLDHLLRDPGVFRITEIFTAGRDTRFPVSPSTNMLYGIDDLGAYSPLMMKRYKDFIQGWGGYVNDSFEVVDVDKDRLLQNINALRFLNVKYVLSQEAVKSDLLQLAQQEPGTYLYEIPRPLPRAYFYSGKDLPKSVFDLSESDLSPVKFSKIDQRTSRYEFIAPQEGFLLTSETSYPGWRASDSVRSLPVLTWNAVFRAVSVSPGRHNIVMQYSPRLYQILTIICLGAMGGGLLFIVGSFFVRKLNAA